MINVPERQDHDDDAKLDEWDCEACILNISRGIGIDLLAALRDGKRCER